MSTPTKEETLAAIDGSIAHWKRHATGTAEHDEGVGAGDCALCQLFLEPTEQCDGCPLYGFTGKAGCGHATWMDANETFKAWRKDRLKRYDLDSDAKQPEFRVAATGMVALLEDTRAWFLADLKTRTAYFERFEITMHSGQCDADVEAWQDKIVRPPECTPERLAAELSEYGAWEDDELKDDAANWRRIIWLAAGNIQEEPLYNPERYKNLPVMSTGPNSETQTIGEPS